MDIAAKLDDFAEGWQIGQPIAISNMNLETELDVREKSVKRVEHLCDTMNRVVDILRRQLAVEVDSVDMLVTISVHVGRCRYFFSSTSLPDPYADVLEVLVENEHIFGRRPTVIILFVRFLLP